MNINDFIKKIKKETSDIEFAYGSSLDENNDFESLLLEIESVSKTLKEFSAFVVSSYDEIKNNEELKKTILETKNNALSVLKKSKNKIQDYYYSDKVQGLIKNINNYSDIPEINKPLSKIKDVAIDATIMSCEKIEQLINKEK